jgi:RNA-directed DNA polymerase
MARLRVRRIQTKLHQWAIDEPDRRFNDLYNLVCDPAVLTEAWSRVKGNRGARSAGVDGQTAHYISAVRGEERCLAELRTELKARSFAPLPVRERMIPKVRREAPPAGDRDRAGPGGASRPEAGARADLRGGLQAV